MSKNPSKKVFVSGCFDILHSGHIALLKEASQFWGLYVGLGSDKTVYDLKNFKDVRLYILEVLPCIDVVHTTKGAK